MPRTKVVQILREVPPGTEVDVRGWVRTKRESKQDFAFLEINDGSCLANVQVVVDANVPDYASLIKQIHTGASVAIIGEVKESLGKGQRVEVHARSLKLLGTADPATYPLQKKGHSMEFLREKAHLRPRTNTFGAIARVRNALCAAIHSFFQSRGFLYVQTPIITTSDCEGAGQVFQVTTLDLAKLQQAKGPLDYSHDFFGKKAGLTVSGQLEGEIFATAVGDVYTFGPTFRAENSNTTRHLAEFWMIEPEAAFFDINDDMDLAEGYLKALVDAVFAERGDDIEFLGQFVDKDLVKTLENTRKSAFVRLTYTEAVEILLKSGKTFEFPVAWGSDLQSEHERFLTEEHFKQPVILTGYPKEIKSFYMFQNEDDKTVAAMDVLVPRIGEIIGGSQREHRLPRLEARITELGMRLEDYTWYLDLHRFGAVPHAGFGLGFERAVMFCTGMVNIRDVVPFPRAVGQAAF